MIWLIVSVAVVLVVLTTAAVLGRVDGSIGDATTTMSHEPLPDSALTDDDLDSLRFDTAVRGYRMSEVDGVVDRLSREVRDLREQLSRIQLPAAPTPSVSTSAPPDPPARASAAESPHPDLGTS